MSGSALPADVAINKDASRGNLLFVILRLESGEELPFVVDTGAAATIVNKSLEPKLGKRLETGTMWNFGVKHKSGVYATPKLYLGNTLLSTSTEVFSTDLKQLSARLGNRIMGILGMDCLRYYCIQLDFEVGQMHFLAPGQRDVAKWGKAFPIMLSTEGNSDGEYAQPYVSCGSLIGGEGTRLWSTPATRLTARWKQDCSGRKSCNKDRESKEMQSVTTNLDMCGFSKACGTVQPTRIS